MSSTTTESVQQRGPVTKKAELEDALMNKIIEHCCQLTLDLDFKNASATYSQVKEQQEQIRTRDERLTRLQKDIEAQRERELVVIGRFSAANQDLAIQKEIAEKRIVSLQKETAEKDKSLVEISRRIQELQRQLQTLLSERSQDERKMSSMIAQHNLEIDSFQRKLKERDASIDKLKESDAKLTSLLSDEKAKRGYLENDKKSLEEKMLKAQSRLEKFDSFILKHHQIDEQSMLVPPPTKTLQVIDFRVQNRWLFEPLGLCSERDLDHSAAGSERRESQSRFSTFIL
jgi:chromosome segregation ATPase